VFIIRTFKRPLELSAGAKFIRIILLVPNVILKHQRKTIFALIQNIANTLIIQIRIAV